MGPRVSLALYRRPPLHAELTVAGARFHVRRRPGRKDCRGSKWWKIVARDRATVTAGMTFVQRVGLDRFGPWDQPIRARAGVSAGRLAGAGSVRRSSWPRCRSEGRRTEPPPTEKPWAARGKTHAIRACIGGCGTWRNRARQPSNQRPARGYNIRGRIYGTLRSENPCRFTIGPASMRVCSMPFITTGCLFSLARSTQASCHPTTSLCPSSRIAGRSPTS